MSLTNLLNKTATVYRKATLSINEFGERQTILSTIVSNLKVALQPLKEELSHSYEGHTYVIRDVVYCSYREDILPGDIIEINNKTYFIISVENDGGRNHHLRMLIVQHD